MSEYHNICDHWIEENSKLHNRIDELSKENQKLQIKLNLRSDVTRIKLKEIEELQDELEKEVQSHVDTASILSNVIKENRLIKDKLKKIEDAYSNKRMDDLTFINEVGDILESI